MSGVVVRPATMGDYEGVCAVYADVDAFHAAGAPGLFRVPDAPGRPRDQIERTIASDDEALLVAEVGGDVVGLAWVVVRQGPDGPSLVPRRFALVDALGVLEPHRSRGVGRLLMHAAEAWARGKGLAEIELSVAGFNERAIAFYERLGYATMMRRMRRTLTDEGGGSSLSRA